MKTPQRVFRVTLTSKPGQIARVETFLKRVDRAIHVDEIQFHKLMVSVTEAVNNAIMHGNKSNPELKVFVVCTATPERLVFSIRDEGKGFNPNRIDNPLKEENLLHEHGRGVFLMRTLMDQVEFYHHKEGTEVVLGLDLKK